MLRSAIHPERVRALNRKETRRGDYVLYWMQQSQRSEWNDALEYAVQEANELGLPVLVGFGLTAGFPEANLRHYTFMLEGLREVHETLKRRGVGMVVCEGDPAEVALRLARRAALVVCDRGYLRVQKAWRRAVAEDAPCRVVQVEADVVVPVETASNKAEYAARTIRPKIMRELERFLDPLPEQKGKVRFSPERAGMKGFDLEDMAAVCRSLKLDASVPAVGKLFRGGTSEAKRIFRAFLRERFGTYAENRGQPQTDDVSHMSKYLHFGQVSPVWLVREACAAARKENENLKSFIDELVVRRELAMNFVEFTADYDRYAALPSWARNTLHKHAPDKREHVYSAAELEVAQTHDPYWNAAMREMRETGYMHNHMRMYWGKKILEWSRTPEEAHATALALNNKFFLDGRDPNSFANVGWVFGLHDRPWGERAVYGTVRSMMASGLERKCDIEAYVRKVDTLCREAGASGEKTRRG